MTDLLDKRRGLDEAYELGDDHELYYSDVHDSWAIRWQVGEEASSKNLAEDEARQVLVRNEHYESVLAMYPEHEFAEPREADGTLPRYLLVQGNDHKEFWQMTAPTVDDLLAYQAADEAGWYPLALWDLDTGEARNVDVRYTLGARAKHDDVHLDEPESAPGPDEPRIIVKLSGSDVLDIEGVPASMGVEVRQYHKDHFGDRPTYTDGELTFEIERYIPPET